MLHVPISSLVFRPSSGECRDLGSHLCSVFRGIFTWSPMLWWVSQVVHCKLEGVSGTVSPPQSYASSPLLLVNNPPHRLIWDWTKASIQPNTFFFSVPYKIHTDPKQIGLNWKKNPNQAPYWRERKNQYHTERSKFPFGTSDSGGAEGHNGSKWL